MRVSLFLCIAAALATGCASNPPDSVAGDQPSAAAVPIAANPPDTQVAQAGEPVSLEVVQSAVPVAKTPQGEELVCKQIATLGTRLTRRVCRTQAQIAYDRQVAKEATEAQQRPVPLQEPVGKTPVFH